MVIVAGPPGSGKSSAFPVANFGTRYFNADDRAAELNSSYYIGIPNRIREIVNQEFEAFVADCIASHQSFAIETTLRSTVTFDQAKRAKDVGFTTEMRYLALESFAMHLERIKQRADAGGHSASERTLRRIHDSSLANLTRAFAEMDDLWSTTIPSLAAR
jgi:predicted ABC-type ATPase